MVPAALDKARANSLCAGTRAAGRHSNELREPQGCGGLVATVARRQAAMPHALAPRRPVAIFCLHQSRVLIRKVAEHVDARSGRKRLPSDRLPKNVIVPMRVDSTWGMARACDVNALEKFTFSVSCTLYRLLQLQFMHLLHSPSRETCAHALLARRERA